MKISVAGCPRNAGSRSARTIGTAFALAAAFSLLATEQAVAQPTAVSVDWVQGRPEVPHPAVQGRQTVLQAIIEGGGCNDYQFRWDLNGDGDFNDGSEHWRNTNSNGHRRGYWAPAGLDFTFPNQAGNRLFYPTVEVRCNGGGATSKVAVPYLLIAERLCSGYPPHRHGAHYNSEMRCNGDQNNALTRQVNNDLAVDKSMWWMFNEMDHYGDDGRGTNKHTCVYWGNYSLYAQGHMLNVFQRRGHGHGPLRDTDVYYRHVVECGFSAMLGSYDYSCDSSWDIDHNGRANCRLYKHDSRITMGGNWMAYGSTAFSEPAGGYGDPDFVSPRHGHTLRYLGQDLADGMVKCQGSNGGWYYSCGGNGGDGSTNGWAPEGLRLMWRKFGNETYGWARDRQRSWLWSHCRNDCHYHGGGPKLAGNSLVGYGWVYLQDYNRGHNSGQVGVHYDKVSGFDHFHWGSYYMYASTKGLRSWYPELTYLGVNNPRSGTPGTVGGIGQGGKDWAAEWSEFLTAWQHSNGSFEWCWQGDHSCSHHWLRNLNRHCITALEAQIVQSWLEAQAFARAIPQATGPGIPVTFDHSWSYFLDSAIRIRRYRWDVDKSNGLNWDWYSDDCGGAFPGNYECQERIRKEPFVYVYRDNIGWGQKTNKFVTLEIQDTEGRWFRDDKSVIVSISLENHKPIVVPHPKGTDAVYNGYFGRPMLFDATLSWDPDECIRDDFGGEIIGNCGDYETAPGRPAEEIVSVCFDTDFDGNWCENGEAAGIKDGATAFPNDDGVKMPVTGRVGTMVFVPSDNLDEGTIVGIPVRVCDKGQWHGGNDPLCGYGTASVMVIRNTDPPAVIIDNPPETASEATLNITGIPPHRSMFSLTDHMGQEKTFIFNHYSDTVDGSMQRPTAEITVARTPGDQQVFSLFDYRGMRGNYVFDSTAGPDDLGTLKRIIGMDHVVVPMRGVNNQAEMAARLHEAILTTVGIENLKLDMTVVREGNKLLLEQNSTALSGNKEIDVSGVDFVFASDFKGGVTIGLETAIPDLGEIANRIRTAIRSSCLDMTIGGEDMAIKPINSDITIENPPANGDVFNVADNAGTTRHFVFDTDSDTVDGTTVEIDEVPHVVVGIASAGNDTTAIANQMEKAINNAGGLRITAEAAKNEVNLSVGVTDGDELVEGTLGTVGSTNITADGGNIGANANWGDEDVTLAVNNVPNNGSIINVSDARGNLQRFVFMNDTEDCCSDQQRNVALVVDGEIAEIPHNVIGIANADAAEVADRLADAINNSSGFRVDAQVSGNQVMLEQKDANANLDLQGAADAAPAEAEIDAGANIAVANALNDGSGQLDVAATPQNGSQITLEDEAGNEATFIFDHNSSATDGSTRIVQGEELVVVGIDGVEGNQAGIADRLADTINNTEDLLIDASSNGNDVNIGTPDGKAVVDVEANVQVTDNFGNDGNANLSVGAAPADESEVSITDARGNETTFVFDDDIAPPADPTVDIGGGAVGLVNDFGDSAMDSQAQMQVTSADAGALDGSTFTLTDRDNDTVNFVVDSSTDTVDGSTQSVDDVAHVTVGTEGANSTTAVAERMAEAIDNAPGLDIDASTEGDAITLDASASPFDVNGNGDVIVGIQGIANDPAAVAEVLAQAIDGTDTLRIDAAPDGNGDIQMSASNPDANIQLQDNFGADGQATLNIAATPEDDSTFSLADQRGTERNFVIDHDSSVVDGSTREIDGEQHIVVGIDGVEGDTTLIANRIEQAVENSGSLRLDIDNNGSQLVLTTNDAAGANIALNTDEIENVESTDFNRGTATLTFEADEGGSTLPEDGATFALQDQEGRSQNFVFDHDSAMADGSTTTDLNGNGQPDRVDLNGDGFIADDEIIPEHVVIGLGNAFETDFSGVGLTEDEVVSLVGSQIQGAINAVPDLEVEAVADGQSIQLTQTAAAPTAQNPTIDLTDVAGLDSTAFSGSVDVAMTQNGVGFAGNTTTDFSDLGDSVNEEASSSFGGGGDGSYTTDPGSPLRMDFSRTEDPEGVVGASGSSVTFQYAVDPALATIQPTRGFEGRADDMGPRPVFVPLIDGLAEVPVTLTSCDDGGLCNEQQVTVTVRNSPPEIQSFSVEASPRPPTLHTTSENITDEMVHNGNNEYSIQFTASPNPGVDAVISFEAVDRFGEALTSKADLDGDGNFEAIIDGGVGEFRQNYAEVPEEGMVQPVTLEISDDDETISFSENVFIPPVDIAASEQLSYFIDVGDDGAYEVVGEDTAQVTFRTGRGTASIPISGFVRDENGFEVPFNLGEVELPNTAPIIASVRVLSLEGFDVTLFHSARDVEKDTLTYTVDWGDGTVPTTNQRTISAHTYPRGVYQTFNVTVTVDDGRRNGQVTHSLDIEIKPPDLAPIDVNALTWTRVTATEGSYDGVPTFGVDPDGKIYAHNYLDEVRVTADDGDNWEVVLADVECCGTVLTRDAGQVWVASPAGLLFSDNAGVNWEVWSENKYIKAALTPDKAFIVAATERGVERYDLTGNLSDSWELPVSGDDAKISDLDACVSPNNNSPQIALTTTDGRLYLNTNKSGTQGGMNSWTIPDDRFSKSGSNSSVSFDDSCNLYQGLWGGYRMWTAPNGPMVPASTNAPKDRYYVAGYSTTNVYTGAGPVTEVYTWEDGPAIVGSERGVWATNEPFNAYRAPSWPSKDDGIDRADWVRKVDINPVSGKLILSTSASQQTPKYCRKVRRGRRGRRRGGRRRGRVQYYYVFCGFNYNYFGGLYVSTESLLAAQIVGQGGREFNNANAFGVGMDGRKGGLVLRENEQQTSQMWLVNTDRSTVSKYDTSGANPKELAEYRVGKPEGECPGQCCFEAGCNMPSRAGVDGRGNAYIASAGYGMQGTVTKLAATLNDCIDRNNSLRIETSRQGEPLPYGQDECVLWTTDVGAVDAEIRALAIDGGDAGASDGYIWVGNFKGDNKMWKLHPEDGRILMEVDLDIQAYGAVAVGSTLYVNTLGDQALQTIDTRTGATGDVIRPPDGVRGGCNDSYSITADNGGRIWITGNSCTYALGYDPKVDGWCRAEGGGLGMGGFGRGITADTAGRVWSAVGIDGASHLAYWRGNQCVPNTIFDVDAANAYGPFDHNGAGLEGPSSVSADPTGRMYLGHNRSTAIVKLDPRNNFEVTTHDGQGLNHSFTDVSGNVRRMSVGKGTYTEDFYANCDPGSTPQWTALDWDVDLPDGSDVVFTVYSAPTQQQLISATGVVVGNASDVNPPVILDDVLVLAGQESRDYIRIRANLVQGNNGISPVLKQFLVRWQCQ